MFLCKGGKTTKAGKRVRSDWAMGAHTVNSYKARVGDPAVKRKRRTSKEICGVLARALNKVKNHGKDVDIRSERFNGKAKIKQLYKINLFKYVYYVLCSNHVVITLFTSEMVENDAMKGGLTFLSGEPFEELKSYYPQLDSSSSLQAMAKPDIMVMTGNPFAVQKALAAAAKKSGSGPGAGHQRPGNL